LTAFSDQFRPRTFASAVYLFAPDRKAERPASPLEDFKGVMHVNGCAGFEPVADKGEARGSEVSTPGRHVCFFARAALLFRTGCRFRIGEGFRDLYHIHRDVIGITVDSRWR
jgi:hypothetical protein